ncbi:glycosyltransferase [Candidatus Nitrosocosmicus agrestis]|jgi:UDP-N-acetylglucosamine--N-acetylmuramyl-(pentapeptide) pyrophosphoryl-undecaprenol N-acetylglucosamine transferase|uniref:glycosyltransferase n=1 Tax=Candidatus Nitrosocosmicus agrestis TaxID=2563600 RepID=UPI00122DFC26|nr:glycosyltransferase [Candidatus Nitrosocosmicus sp. SS]KAA2280830.1 UDP-glucuronosyltransferase [Candidatus Nitrosocosmicus sp. SS]KAF0868915.1 UDP-glucuronosyltransferase [Candidatus Nitrosocosmicus sp. SS]
MIYFFSSPIGLGHVTRDIAITQRIIEYSKNLKFNFVTGSNAYQFMNKAVMQWESCGSSISNLYFPPQFSIRNGELKNNFLWLLKYLLYYKKCKNTATTLLLSVDKNPNGKDLVISDEDFASLTASKEQGISSIFITDILNTKFLRTPIISLFEKYLNQSMQKLLAYSKCVIVPEIGDSVDNIFYVGPIVRDITMERNLLRQKLRLHKKTVLITTGGTNSGSYLIDKALLTLLGFKNKFDFDILVSNPADITLKKKSDWYIDIGFAPNINEYIYASDLVISLAGKSTIDECFAYGTPGIFIPIKNHFEQEERAKKLGFSANDINNLLPIFAEYLSNLGSRRKKKNFDGDVKAAKIILSYLNKD